MHVCHREIKHSVLNIWVGEGLLGGTTLVSGVAPPWPHVKPPLDMNGTWEFQLGNGKEWELTASEWKGKWECENPFPVIDTWKSEKQVVARVSQSILSIY